MCFSAEASFLASAFLLPAGTTALGLAWASERRQLVPLAAAPLLFGLQQLCEGILWLAVAAPPSLPPPSQTLLPQGAALAYLFFAYAFWPIWMPLAAVAQMPPHPQGPGERLWQRVPLLGLVPALLLWLPLLSQPGDALPKVIGHSLAYPMAAWSASLIPAELGSLLYAALIVLPFLKVPSKRVQVFALTLLLTFGLTRWIAKEALASVWCYASALLSIQILWIVHQSEPKPEAAWGEAA